ncbi:unnamed protein product [Sphenostylis stenocarpa]|uniref:Uncharacterized protein n=1 Tax=Sphenostylis stenocarpa TaxID=92480 RepID=A0AA86VUC5_9FABA|nr:unnamed protein product [Sphenostylis stenocarpa]
MAGRQPTNLYAGKLDELNIIDVYMFVKCLINSNIIYEDINMNYLDNIQMEPLKQHIILVMEILILGWRKQILKFVSRNDTKVVH